jgi:hypothetical protein
MSSRNLPENDNLKSKYATRIYSKTGYGSANGKLY